MSSGVDVGKAAAGDRLNAHLVFWSGEFLVWKRKDEKERKRKTKKERTRSEEESTAAPLSDTENGTAHESASMCELDDVQPFFMNLIKHGAHINHQERETKNEKEQTIFYETTVSLVKMLTCGRSSLWLPSSNYFLRNRYDVEWNATASIQTRADRIKRYHNGKKNEKNNKERRY